MKRPILLVSTRATAYRVAPALKEEEERGKQYTAILELPQMLVVSSGIVTIDAIVRQSSIVPLLTQRRAYFVPMLKQNQARS